MTTVTSTVPVPGGTVAVICVSLTTLKEVAALPPNVTAMVLHQKPSPVMVTTAPPAAGPLAGDTPVTPLHANETENDAKTNTIASTSLRTELHQNRTEPLFLTSGASSQRKRFPRIYCSIKHNFFGASICRRIMSQYFCR
ncbi:MAG TPA: hypothetical protein VNQ56_09375 [Pseudolabrys sp.]|nr:hypothetical protein [Pseudolabrys sp.]